MAEVFGAVVSGLTIAEIVTKVRALCHLINSYQRRGDTINGLLVELRALLKLLKQIDSIIINPVDSEDLELPLRQCAHLCKDFQDLILKCTYYSDAQGKSKRDWMQVTINDDEIRCVRDLIDSYKSTISIVIGTMNIRVSRMNAGELKQWCETISSTSHRLEQQMAFIDQQIKRLSGHGTTLSTTDSLQRQWLLVERENVRTCLAICDRGATETQQLLHDLPEESQVTQEVVEPKLSAKQLGEVLRSNSESYGNIHKQYSMRLQEIEGELQSSRLANYELQCQIGEEHRQKVFEKASKEATKRYEDIMAAEDACQIIGSNPGENLIASRITAGPRSEQHLGVSEAVLLARFRSPSPASEKGPELKERSTQASKMRLSILRRLLSCG